MPDVPATRLEKAVTDRWESFKKSGKGLAATFGIIGLVGWWLLSVVARSLADTGVGRVAAAILSFFSFVAMQPLGLGLVLLLVVVALVLLYVAWDAREKHTTSPASDDAPQAILLSADEKDAISKIRWLWVHQGGAASANLLLSLFDEVLYVLPREFPGSLLKPLRDQLNATAVALQSDLDISRAVSLDAIVARFNDFHSAYLHTAAVLYQLHQAKQLNLFVDPFVEPLKRFRACDKSFRRELVAVTEFPGINKRLLVFPAIPGLDSRRFIGAERWEGEQPPAFDGPSE